jgi:hypothetical protein
MPLAGKIQKNTTGGAQSLIDRDITSKFRKKTYTGNI